MIPKEDTFLCTILQALGSFACDSRADILLGLNMGRRACEARVLANSAIPMFEFLVLQCDIYIGCKNFSSSIADTESQCWLGPWVA